MNLVYSDIHQTGANVGLNVFTDTIIAAGVQVTADQDAVEITASADLYNYGAIISSGNYGIHNSGATFTLFNDTQGTITGGAGIVSEFSVTAIDNYGTILGFDDYGVYNAGSAGYLKVANHGLIKGTDIGIGNYSGTAGGLIENTGRIEGGAQGVLIDTVSGLVTSIINSGTIGGNYSIAVEHGSVNLTNKGALNGTLDLTAANNQNDVIINAGKILGDVYLGGGADLFVGTGGTSGRILGGGGADRIIGGAGGESIESGAGNDVLTGGAGADHFYFSDALSASTNVDKITDFSVPQDTIDLAHNIFNLAAGKLSAAMFYKGAHAHDANDHIIYNAKTGVLLYDANGSAAGGEVKFATLAHHPALSAADFLVI